MKNKFYITTSIAYANANPHIGFALESIQADVLARYNRSLDKDVFFLTGTDEHGQKIEKKAIEVGKNPAEFVKETTENFKKLKDSLNLSNDFFINTTDKERHWPSVIKVWNTLKDNGDLEKKSYKGLYCVGCEGFITEKELVDGKCPVHGKEPEVVEEENWFFLLSKYTKKIKEVLESGEVEIIPEAKKNEMLTFLNEGLEDISFSRSKESLSWGIPVPGDETQTMYVWADALTNYISALGFDKDSEEFKKFWPADVHCVGKDILKFHSLIWLGILLSLELELPKKIFVHGFITVDGKKISKSLGNVINPFDLVDKYGVDPVRYFLLRELPSSEDGDFSYERFEERFNGELANGLGNLVSRTITLANKLEDLSIEGDDNFVKAVEEAKEKVSSSLDSFKFNEGLKHIWELVSLCDSYIGEEKPWEDTENKKKVIENVLFVLINISELISPFLPETSSKIKEIIETKKKENLFPRL
jgi:methionyl-tRNA synthetase